MPDSTTIDGNGAVRSDSTPTGPSALYICYQSLLDPLTQTQVVAYLEGLAGAGYRIALLTFEKQRLTNAEDSHWREHLTKKGIAWHRCRYHKRPTVPATLWDILVGVVFGLRLIRKYRVQLIHARSHVPGVMAMILKRMTGAKMVFDIRGFMAEEYVDAGVWPAHGLLFRATKRVERWLVSAADGLVVLTTPARALLEQSYPDQIRDKPLMVIPCCVDLRHSSYSLDAPLDRAPKQPTVVYVGKLDGWYLTEAMVDFITVAIDLEPGLQWQIWTQSDSNRLRALIDAKGIAPNVTIGRVAADELPQKLRQASAGLSFIKPCISKCASSPTKVGEYLAAGLPVVSNRGIGDLDTLLEPAGADGSAIGVLTEPESADDHRVAVRRLMQLLGDQSIGSRCRAAAHEHLDLEAVGWARYRNLYRHFFRDGAAA